MTEFPSPIDILEHDSPTRDFLCRSSANKYNLEFLDFKVTDATSKNVIFGVGKNKSNISNEFSKCEPDLDLASIEFGEHGPIIRKMKYTMSEDVLRLPCISTTLTFKVGGKCALSNLRVIERLYFEDRLIKSFDFTFGFCIPGSVNTWECTYILPPLEGDLVEDMIDYSFKTTSDTFYFVDDELVIHNKASYNYIREDKEEGKSYHYLWDNMKRVSIGQYGEESKFGHGCESKEDLLSESKDIY